MSQLRQCDLGATPNLSPISYWSLRQPRTRVYVRCVASQSGNCDDPSIQEIFAQLRIRQAVRPSDHHQGVPSNTRSEAAICQNPNVGSNPAPSDPCGQVTVPCSASLMPLCVSNVNADGSCTALNVEPMQTDPRYVEAARLLGQLRVCKFGLIEEVEQVNRVIVDLMRPVCVGLPSLLIHLVPVEKRHCLFSGAEGALTFVLDRVLKKACVEIEVVCFNIMNLRFYDGLDQPELPRRIFSRPPDRIPVLEPPIARRPVNSSAELPEILETATRNLVRHEMGTGRRRLGFIYTLYLDSCPMHFVDIPMDGHRFPGAQYPFGGHRHVNSAARTLAYCMHARHSGARFVPWRDHPIPRLLSHPITHGRTAVVCTVPDRLGESELATLRLASGMVPGGSCPR